MSLLMLYLLATLDAMCIGYREAAGHSALVRKGPYVRAALQRGALTGQVVNGLVGGAALLLLLPASDPEALLEAMIVVSSHALHVYVPYAVIVGLAFAVRLIPSVDLRSLAHVLIFGPCLLIRPLVILAGMAWGVAANPRPELIGLAGLALVLLLSLERALAWARGQCRGHWSYGPR